MFCTNCGKEISKEGKYCRFCGASVGEMGTGKAVEVEDKPIPLVQNEEYLKKIKHASYGIYALGGLALAQIFLSGFLGVEVSEDQVLGGLIIAVLVFISGHLTLKIPKIILPLAVLWGLYDSFEFLVQSFNLGYVEQSFGFFIMWACIRLLILLVIFEGLFWAFKKGPDLDKKF